MSTTVERLENNRAKLTFGVDAKRFEEGMQFAYNKTKSRIHIPGFRQGKAPRKIIEIQYGKQVFYDDAINFCLPDAYETATEESQLEIVSRPEIDVESMDEENGIVFTAEVELKPVVTVTDYKGITYKETSMEVTEEEIEKEINKDREKNARELTITDRGIQDGDIAIIDYEGFVDGEAFAGGKDTDHELTIGSHSFIDTFEDQLIGHNVGDDLDVTVTFPEEYHAKELQGKQAIFKVEIKDVKFRELPEVNDDFAADVSEFDTLDEYKNSIKEKLAQAKEANISREKEEQIMRGLIEKTAFDLPKSMVESQIDSLVERFTNNIRMQGLPVEMYLQYMGQTMESLREVYRVQAEQQVRGRLCLEAVADAEGIEISEDEMSAEIDRLAEAYKIERARMEAALDKKERKAMTTDLKVQKALDIVMNSAVAI